MSQLAKLSSLITFILLSFLTLSSIGYSHPVSPSSDSTLKARRLIPEAGNLLDSLLDNLRFNDPQPADNERAQPESDNTNVVNHSIKKTATYGNSHNSTAKDAKDANEHNEHNEQKEHKEHNEHYENYENYEHNEQKNQQDKNFANTISFLGRVVETLGHDLRKDVGNSDDGKLL